MIGFGLSVVFVIWLAVCISVSLLRVAHLFHNYAKWKMVSDLERRALVIVPSLCAFAYWAEFQRLNYLHNVFLHHWKPVDDWGLLVNLTIGTAGVAGIMWAMLCSVFGERVGSTMWRRVLVLGIGVGALVAATGE